MTKAARKGRMMMAVSMTGRFPMTRDDEPRPWERRHPAGEPAPERRPDASAPRQVHGRTCFRGRAWRWCSSAQGKKKDQNQTRHEEEGVSLEVPRLHEAQGAAKDFRRTVQAANPQAGDDPAVKP